MSGDIKTSGWVVFAGVMTSLAAASNLIYGLTLLLKDEWIVFTQGAIVTFDLTTVGVIYLVLAALLLFVALGIFQGELWARIVGIIAASLSLLSQMAFLSVYPEWSWAILIIDVLIIYGLAVHGDEVAEL